MLQAIWRSVANHSIAGIRIEKKRKKKKTARKPQASLRPQRTRGGVNRWRSDSEPLCKKSSQKRPPQPRSRLNEAKTSKRRKATRASFVRRFRLFLGGFASRDGITQTGRRAQLFCPSTTAVFSKNLNFFGYTPHLKANNHIVAIISSMSIFPRTFSQLKAQLFRLCNLV